MKKVRILHRNRDFEAGKAGLNIFHFSLDLDDINSLKYLVLGKKHTTVVRI